MWVPLMAFASMAAVPELDVKIMATALGAGILLDATILRALLVPALVALLGRWNWWLPPWAARVLRVPPSVPAPSPGLPAPEAR
jgi:putative drug exporter of the RND superfamily